MRTLFILLFLALCFGCGKNRDAKTLNPLSYDDSLISIQNTKISLEISLHGGAITGLRFINDSINPFTWRLHPYQMPENNRKGAPYQGHFVCVGRWGIPTSGEVAAGVPSNGEPANNWWKSTPQGDKLKLSMQVEAGLEKYSMKRDIVISENDPCFTVDETLSNNLNSGRYTAIVQHSTIGPPFLNPRTTVNTNATKGFNQSLIDTSITKHEYVWPMGYADSSLAIIDMTRSDHPYRYVSTHIIEDEYGWVTVFDPVSAILLGYIWQKSDYPWLHIWHGMLKGRMWAKGMEFGTTGLRNLYPPEKTILTEFHGVNNNLFIDAKTSISRKYACFFVRMPSDFRKTESVTYSNNTIHINYLTSSGKGNITLNQRVW